MSRAIVTQLGGVEDIPQILVLLENIHNALLESNTKNVNILCLIPGSKIESLRTLVQPLFSELIVLAEDNTRLDYLLLKIESLYTRYDNILYINPSMFPVFPSCLLDLFQNVKQNQILASANPAWPDIFNASVFSIKPNLTDFQTIQNYFQFENSFSTSDIDFICYVLEHFEWINLPYLYNITVTQLHEKHSYEYLPATQRFYKNVKMVNFENEKPWKTPYNSVNYRYSRQWFDCWLKLFPHLSTIDVENTLALENCVKYFTDYINKRKEKLSCKKVEDIKSDTSTIPVMLENNTNSDELTKPVIAENEAAITESHNDQIFVDFNTTEEKPEDDNVDSNEFPVALTSITHAPSITIEDLRTSYTPDHKTDTQTTEKKNEIENIVIYDSDKKANHNGNNQDNKENEEKFVHCVGHNEDTAKKVEKVVHGKNIIPNKVIKMDSSNNLINLFKITPKAPVWNSHNDVEPERVFHDDIEQKDSVNNIVEEDSKKEDVSSSRHSKEKKSQDEAEFDSDRPYIPPSVVPERVFMDDPVVLSVSEVSNSPRVSDAKMSIPSKDELRNRVMSFFTNPDTYSAFKTVNEYQSWNPTTQDPKDLQQGKGEAQLLKEQTESSDSRRDLDINKKQNERILNLFSNSLENQIQPSTIKVTEVERVNLPVDGLITPMSSNKVLDSLSSLSIDSTSTPCSPEVSSPNLSELDSNFDFSLHPWSKDKKYLKYLKQGSRYKNLFTNKKNEKKKLQQNFEATKKPLKSILKKPHSKILNVL